VRKRSSYIFYYRNIFCSNFIEKASRQSYAKGMSFPLVPRQNVHLSRYFLEPLNRLLRTKYRVRQSTGRFLAPEGSLESPHRPEEEQRRDGEAAPGGLQVDRQLSLVGYSKQVSGFATKKILSAKGCGGGRPKPNTDTGGMLELIRIESE
jgi:hypothetical protein